jgi:hypothetical protein
MHHHEALARRIIAEIEQMTDGRPMRWVALQQVARRLQIRRTFVAEAVRVAIDEGWLTGEGKLQDSVCLTNNGRAMATTGLGRNRNSGLAAGM